MHFNPTVAAGYSVLLLSSLAIPFLHLHVADLAIEHTRMVTEFLPAHFLFWRWLGDFAWVFPVVVITLYLLSLRREKFGRTSTLLGLATAQVLFVTLYGVYCGFLLSHLLLLGGLG
ncbi:MAG: hypothetical protein H0X66_15980 [Verrucomicrobia bacterium]|nr:hypothetical protein [Verrucomicrobiota bacterium]